MKYALKAVLVALISALCSYGSEDMPIGPKGRTTIDFSQTLRGRIENGVLIWKSGPLSKNRGVEKLELLKKAFQMWQDLADTKVKFQYGGIATERLAFNVAMEILNKPKENVVMWGSLKDYNNTLGGIAGSTSERANNGKSYHSSRFIFFNDDRELDDEVFLGCALHEIGHWLGFDDIKNDESKINIMSYSKNKHRVLGDIEKKNVLKWYSLQTAAPEKQAEAPPPKEAPSVSRPWVYVLRDGRKLEPRTTQEQGDWYIFTSKDGEQEEVKKSDVIEVKK